MTSVAVGCEARRKASLHPAQSCSSSQTTGVRLGEASACSICAAALLGMASAAAITPQNLRKSRRDTPRFNND